MSTVLERNVHEQTLEFLNKHNILYKFQSGSRKKYSTDFCLSYLIGKISKGFDSDPLTEMILIDLQTAFDTIDRNMLLLKIPALVISREVLISISHTYSVGDFMFTFMANSLPLPVYDA